MSRYKPKVTGTPEVHNARSKLDGLLQTMVEKKDESPLKEEPIDEFETSHSAPSTPKKASSTGISRSSRKRKRGRDDYIPIETNQYHHTFRMKLFDRSVDLAQFEPDTPLYPICRAWMKNQPHNQNLAHPDRSPDHNHLELEEGENGENCVYSLPAPVPIKTEEGGEEIDLRIPIPIDKSEEPLDIHADSSTVPAAENLLVNHMMRWKQVRHSWREAARINELRYSESMKTLKDMYDAQCKDQ